MARDLISAVAGYGKIRLRSVRSRLTPILLALLGAVSVAACGASSSSSSGGSQTAATSTSSAASSSESAVPLSGTTSTQSATGSGQQLGFEGVPLQQDPALAPAATTRTGPVDGISCAPVEQLTYHIHAHLAVFVNGRLASLPGGIGIPGSVTQPSAQGPIAAGGQCYYWLHTHTSDGVIHIESPSPRIYTLGNFFDEWHQPLSANRVAGVQGPLTALVNGKPWKRSPRAIPLIPHEDVQFDIGEPTPPLVSVNWSQTGL